MATSTGGDAALEAAVDELYGLAPEAFLGRRTALAAAAKSAGDGALATAIGALRKPTVAAWAVNIVARRRPELTAALADLAERMRGAQQRLDGAALLDLGRERAGLVDGLVAATVEAVAGAGGRLTPAAAAAVGTTFVAACADPAATQAVVSGRLTRALEYAGFGEVDLHEATARPLRLVRSTAPAASGADGDPAEAGGAGGSPAADPVRAEPAPDPVVAAAEAELREAMAAATSATARHGVLTAEAELADNRVTQLQAELATARSRRDDVLDRLGAADALVAAAQRRLRSARAAVEALR